MLYSCASLETLDPSIARYLHSEVPQSARFSEKTHCFHYTKEGGRPVQCGGIHTMLQRLFYSHYQSNRSQRDHARVNVVGSDAKKGQLIDSQLDLAVEGKKPEGRTKWHRMTLALLEYWRVRGHTLQATQIPVELCNGWGRMTKADVITKAPDGKLWLWEIKTGYPVGFYRKQKWFQSAPLKDIDCTQQNIWFLQLHYTHQALHTNAGIRIEGGARILQVYAKKGEKQLTLEERTPPEWLTSRVPLWAPPLGVPVVVKHQKRPRETE